MTKQSKKTKKSKFSLNKQGSFVIENYNQSKPFSNFFPGIAGLWGIPMWVFYVNRGQCIASFGIESKDKAIMEFQPANKAYRLTSTQGFRTFIKVSSQKKVQYWEPFQEFLPGTDYDKEIKMSMTAHDLTIEEQNNDLGLSVEVNYFTLPEEPFSALVRRVKIKNLKSSAREIEMVDGMPVIIPYGLTDGLNKNIARTVEAWVKVRNVQQKAPYYQLNVEVSDKPEVKHIKEGNFYFAFDSDSAKVKLLSPIVEAASLFGSANDYTAPQNFFDKPFKVSSAQQTSNRSPSAMSYTKFSLKAGGEKEIVSFFGYAHELEQVNQMISRVCDKKYLNQKAARNEEIIAQIKNYTLTNSSSREFNLYSQHTFLDNILRGGLPVSLKTSEGNVAFNVYSRKHGDLERDYNYFFVAPTFYTQGNGNYRDVNQNRRNDVWFNRDVKDSHLTTFLNLIQADGYNPLVVKGTSFLPSDVKKLEEVLKQTVQDKDIKAVKEFLSCNFLPGAFLEFIDKKGIQLKVDQKDFLGRILEISAIQEIAQHGEGFWSDHWTYNLDLIESFLAFYPEQLHHLVIGKKDFTFYHSDHYVLPRDQRYILTSRGVRQYESVKDAGKEIPAEKRGNLLRVKNGQGEVYYTNLICKLLCLLANKAASFDPSGAGLEMEADKPNWYDALNGLPGLLGSSLSESLEVKRWARFLLDAINKLSLRNEDTVHVFEELASFVDGLRHLLSTEKDPQAYWNKSNDIKERYRSLIVQGISGQEYTMSVESIKGFLTGVIKKVDKAINAAKDEKGFLSTYFYHEVLEYKTLDKANESVHFVRPLKFKKHHLPLFLEGYVHALRVGENPDDCRRLYKQVKSSNLYDRKLKMYKVNANLSGESEEIGRTRIFPSGWLENESIWLHMEYKFILELIRQGLYEEYYENFQNALVAFLNPAQYGRSILENSSFIVSSAHEDDSLHGQGFVARLSGSTAEFLHMWLLMNVGKQPFVLSPKNELELRFAPILTAAMFTKEKTKCSYFDKDQNKHSVELPKNTYAFIFLGGTLVVYHTPKRKNTFGQDRAEIKEIQLTYPNGQTPVKIKSSIIGEPYSKDV
ncbi:MAG: hypothetical protein KC733_03395, partial [Candidatus Omnitrophica bacterium]|nr:hypothetical protein [Candidatus Omnitrophota bacterium]